MNNAPSSHPTTSDISQLMRDFGFKWSNDTQIYYYESSLGYEYVSLRTAEILYSKILGNKPYEPIPNSLLSR